MMVENNYNRRCIDGSVHGCGVCKGYCSFHEHPGYLTEKHMTDHQCIEKGCYYLVQKEKSKRPKKPFDNSTELIRMAKIETSSMEGLKVLRAEHTGQNKWTVYYIAIASYFLGGVEASLSSIRRETIRFKKLPYSFENAARIIMGR